ncbi:rho guanine nucleotide exchange factor 1b isoform X2 [Electrophorus electricus]|uniref:rho guanine nucleotide exchange factor 1b isoform X2 n=1 Tax=Electrophorus electricus TaxID=8005 RepID=UPI0015CFC8A1|nr:rho guanine nucleotide exchange factor 1b isoform X2 [Electrophorus electricus]
MDCEDAHDGWGPAGAHMVKNIIGAEDEDFENDLDPTIDDQCIHFTSMELLKARPTHLLVFLHHVILQFDCAPVLCYLHAEIIRNLTAKETKKQFLEFYNNFLDKGAILRVSVPANVSYELDRTRLDLIPEDLQKRYAQDIQNMQAPEVHRQLIDFRQKRMMGMTPNEHELTEVENHYPTDRVPREMKEKAVAEMLLEKLSETNPSIVADDDKCSAIFSAVAFYMKQLGVKSRAPDSKKSRGFFRRRPPKKEEPKHTKVRNILSEATVWLTGSGNELKPNKMESEGDRDKSNHERKGSGIAAAGRGPGTEGMSLPSQSRKVVPPGPSPTQVPETSEAAHGSIATSTPDTPHTDTGLPSSRSDTQTVSDGGDVSPACPTLGVTVWENSSPSDTPLEESHDKDRSVRRSESLCVERRHSHRGGSARAKQFRSRSDVDLQPAATSHPPSPSPHHSVFVDTSLPPTDSPTGPDYGPLPQQEEVEPRLLELEQDPPNWRELAPSEVLNKLSKKETKRQEVINELFATEHAHVRMLSVLQTVFSRPLEREEIMNTNEVSAIFPNLDDIIEMHYAFYENLKKLRQDDGYVVKMISTPLLNIFNGSEGEWFQKLTARFCSHQSWALDQIKSRQRKDPRFNMFILEAESKPQCRRLQLKDIIPIEMQRLTKYPLLLENIAKSTEDNAERENIQQAAECCRKILNHVNEEVKHMENLLTLKDYQRRLDTSGLKPSNDLYMEYKSFDMTSRKMNYEGPLTWRVTKEKAIEVQGVLLGDLLVLLQKQDDKMLLKCQSKSFITTQESKQMLSPIIKLDSAFLRDVATDRKAFYVIFTWDSGAQIYELVSQTVADKKIWTDMIKSAVDELKKNGGSTLDRKRHGSVPASSMMSYSASLNPPLSPTENGTDPLKNTSRDKDSLTDEKGRHSLPVLIDYLAANRFDPLGHSNAPPEKLANEALDEVVAMKRLLVWGISPSDNAQADGEDGATLVTQETDGQSLVEVQSTHERLDGEEVRGEEEQGIAAPLALSFERMDELRNRLYSLEDKLKRLQNIEEDYHRLQEVLAKFIIQSGKYN